MPPRTATDPAGHAARWLPHLPPPLRHRTTATSRSSPTRSPASTPRPPPCCSGPAPRRPRRCAGPWPATRTSPTSSPRARRRPRSDRDATVVVDVGRARRRPRPTTTPSRPTAPARSSGRTRTLPDGPTDAVRLGVVSCANLARAPLTVYRAVAGVEDLDLVLHLGDYIYEDDGERGHIAVDPPHDLVTLEDYRLRYRQARADTDLQQLHSRVPLRRHLGRPRRGRQHAGTAAPRPTTPRSTAPGPSGSRPRHHRPPGVGAGPPARPLRRGTPLALGGPRRPGRGRPPRRPPRWAGRGARQRRGRRRPPLARPGDAERGAVGLGRGADRATGAGPWSLVASSVPVSEMHLPMPGIPRPRRGPARGLHDQGRGRDLHRPVGRLRHRAGPAGRGHGATGRRGRRSSRPTCTRRGSSTAPSTPTASRRRRAHREQRLLHHDGGQPGPGGRRPGRADRRAAWTTCAGSTSTSTGSWSSTSTATGCGARSGPSTPTTATPPPAG